MLNPIKMFDASRRNDDRHVGVSRTDACDSAITDACCARQIDRDANADGYAALPVVKNRSLVQSQTKRSTASTSLRRWLALLSPQRRGTPSSRTGRCVPQPTPFPVNFGEVLASAAMAQQAKALMAQSTEATEQARLPEGSGQWLVVFCELGAKTLQVESELYRQFRLVAAWLRNHKKTQYIFSGGRSRTDSKHDYSDPSASYYALVRAVWPGVDAGVRQKFWPENRAMTIEEQAWFSVRLLDAQVAKKASCVDELVVFCTSERRCSVAKAICTATHLSTHLQDVHVVLHSSCSR